MNNIRSGIRKNINPASLYDLVSIIGEGAYGCVYKAYLRHQFPTASTPLVEYAVKIIPISSAMANDEKHEQWNEIEVLQRLSCPYVVSFIESFIFDDELWLVLELCSGGSLNDLLEELNNQDERLSEDEIKAIVSYCLLGIKHLHTNLSIHRDIKPGNILLTKSGKVKLGDFGISAQLSEKTMKRRTVVGSPFYMAPEIIDETSYDGKVDIWSLGITILELCEGRPPHHDKHGALKVLFAITEGKAPRLKDPDRWSTDMVDFVHQCLVKEVDQRASVNRLITHPWVQDLIRKISDYNEGLNVLRVLLNKHVVNMEQNRNNRFQDLVDLLIDNSEKKHDDENEKTFQVMLVREQSRISSISSKSNNHWNNNHNSTKIQFKSPEQEQVSDDVFTSSDYNYYYYYY